MSFAPSLFLLLTLMAAAPLTAQNIVTDSTAQVLAHWEPGDTRVYDVERVKTGSRPGRSNYRITLRVLDATDSTYQLECRYSDLRVEAASPEDPRSRALMDRLMRATEGMRVVCNTDGTGVPLGLGNEQEVAEHARTVLGQVLELAGNPEERSAMEQAFSGVLSTQALAQGALEDIGNLLFAHGVEYTLGRTERVQAEVANPLGGPPLKAVQAFTMTRLDARSRKASMHMDQHIDPRTLEDGMDALLEGMGGDEAMQEELRRLFRSMTVSDTMDIDMELDGAWTLLARSVRTVELDGERESDTRTYTQR